MQVLIYECPHCGTQVEVTEDMLDQMIHCKNPDCRQPFLLGKQVARMVGTREVDDSESVEAELHQATARDEKTLKTIHPALFRRHPFQGLGSLALVVLGVAGGIYFAVAGNPALAIAGGVLAVVGVALIGLWYLRILFTTLTITTRRSVLRKGIVARRTSEVRHNDVRNLQVDQNVIERLLGVGDLAVSSAGQDDLEIAIEGIPNPSGVADMIRELQTD